MQETIFIGGGGEGYATPQSLKLKYANRHGLIAGNGDRENRNLANYGRGVFGRGRSCVPVRCEK